MNRMGAKHLLANESSLLRFVIRGAQRVQGVKILPIVLAALCFAAVGRGAVTRVQVIERGDVLGGRSFGKAGAYERIVGRVYFAVDPNNPANQIITDIALAPRNADGLDRKSVV